MKHTEFLHQVDDLCALNSAMLQIPSCRGIREFYHDVAITYTY